MQGCAFAALDLYVSSLTGSPVTAAILAFGANFTLWMLDLLETAVTLPWLASVMRFFSLYSRNEPFLMGQLSLANIVYDLSFALACLVLTIHALDARRYRGS